MLLIGYKTGVKLTKKSYSIISIVKVTISTFFKDNKMKTKKA